MQANPNAEFHPSHGVQLYEADIWCEEVGVIFKVSFHATSADAGEAYCRRIYPDITTIYVYEPST